MDRRRFLKYTGATVAIVGASALGLNYSLKPEIQTPVPSTLSSSSSSVTYSTSSISSSSTTSALTQDNLNSMLEPIRQQNNVPGLTAAFVRGKDLTALGAVGTRRLGATERVQLNDLWHLGSDTKSMTATLIAMLVEQGKLTWQTTIADTFPDLLGRIQPDYHNLNLIQLCSHRAGIPGQDKGQDAYSKLNDQLWNLKGPLIQQRRTVVELVLSQPPVSAPGSLFNYSNYSYIIAGAFTEQVTGEQWEPLIQRMLFKPLAMESVGFGPPGTPGKLDQPWGHTKSCEPLDPGNPSADNPPVLGPAGTVHSSMSDWARYATLHLLGAQGKQGLLLKPESFQQLHKDWYQQGYALGWELPQRTWASGVALQHNGFNNLWYADIWIAPQRNAALLAATNTTDCPSVGVGFKACDAAIAAMISKYL